MDRQIRNTPKTSPPIRIQMGKGKKRCTLFDFFAVGVLCSALLVQKGRHNAQKRFCGVVFSKGLHQKAIMWLLRVTQDVGVTLVNVLIEERVVGWFKIKIVLCTWNISLGDLNESILQKRKKNAEKFSELAESNRRHLGNSDTITAERHSQLDEVRSQSSLKFLLQKLLYILYLCRSFSDGLSPFHLRATRTTV